MSALPKSQPRTRVMELHAPVRPIKRAEGRSATKTAAYISGTYIYDERTAEGHDYSSRARRNEIEYATLLLPDTAPDWSHDRAKLWNSAEQREKRKDAQTGRTLIMAMPYEFDAEERQRSAHAIGQWIVERYGLATDMAIHRPDKRGDARNYHLHVVFAGRKFNGEGWAAKKDCPLDDRFGKGRDEIKAMRQHIADVLNDTAARGNHDVYVEHMSFKDRGIDREPTQHMGQIATQKERLGQNTEIGDKNRAIQKRNVEREKLHARKNVIDIEIARERLQPPALQNRAQARLDAWDSFYTDTARRRQAMLADLDRLYGQQEKDLRAETVQIHKATENSSRPRRLWRLITGTAAREKERRRELELAYEAIQERRKAAAKDFEEARKIRMAEWQETLAEKKATPSEKQVTRVTKEQPAKKIVPVQTQPSARPKEKLERKGPEPAAPLPEATKTFEQVAQKPPQTVKPELNREIALETTPDQAREIADMAKRLEEARNRKRGRHH